MAAFTCRPTAAPSESLAQSPCHQAVNRALGEQPPLAQGTAFL